MYHFALCDDDTVFVSSFIPQLEAVCRNKSIEYQLTIYTDIPSLIQAMNGGVDFDLIFMDIFVLDKNGMDHVREMRTNRIKTDIIFISISTEYALEGYDVKPLHYLLKPVSSEKLKNALEHFLEIHIPDNLALPTPKGIVRMTVSDILYIEIYGHKISIHTQTDGVIPYCGTLKEMENILAPYSFIRSHKSYMLNLAHVVRINSRKIWLSNGLSFPISRTRYKLFQSQLIEYANSH